MRYTYAQLAALPTLSEGQDLDEKINRDGRRVFLTRDPDQPEVIEESWDPDARDGRGEWQETDRYPVTKDDDPDDPVVECDVAPEFFDDPDAGQRRLLTILAQSDVDGPANTLLPAPYNERTLMTPTTARDLLEKYTPYSRPLKQTQVDRYVRMLSTPEAKDPEGFGLLDEIAISPSGHTVAGRALLHAIVQADVSVEVLVRRNHPGPARLTPDGADPAYMARLLAALNDRDSTEGARWYLSESELSSTAHEDGKLRRIELWHLTDTAARAAGLLD